MSSFENNDYLYRVKKLDITNSDNIANFTLDKEETTCVKKFPIFENGKYYFKPLSKQKPAMTPMFAVAEVFSAKLAEFMQYDHAEYELAQCKGIVDMENKYLDRGVLTKNFLKDGHQVYTLQDYYLKNPTTKFDMRKYINFAFCVYNFHWCFDIHPFNNNTQLAEDFYRKILFKYLIVDQNAHFGNMGFIKDSEGNIIGGLPIFDNEYSNMFCNLDSDEKMQGYYELYMQYATPIISEIKKRSPRCFQEFQEKIADMKDKDYFARLCDFSKLSSFVQNYSSNYYERSPYTTPASRQATQESMQMIEEKMYDEFNNHIDTLLNL